VNALAAVQAPEQLLLLLLHAGAENPAPPSSPETGSATSTVLAVAEPAIMTGGPTAGAGAAGAGAVAKGAEGRLAREGPAADTAVTAALKDVPAGRPRTHTAPKRCGRTARTGRAPRGSMPPPAPADAATAAAAEPAKLIALQADASDGTPALEVALAAAHMTPAAERLYGPADSTELVSVAHREHEAASAARSSPRGRDERPQRDTDGAEDAEEAEAELLPAPDPEFATVPAAHRLQRDGIAAGAAGSAADVARHAASCCVASVPRGSGRADTSLSAHAVSSDARGTAVSGPGAVLLLRGRRHTNCADDAADPPPVKAAPGLAGA